MQMRTGTYTRVLVVFLHHRDKVHEQTSVKATLVQIESQPCNLFAVVYCI